MFDYRYHALSLAAVLLALAVGVVIGVAIGDSNLVSSAKNGIVHDLSSEVQGAQQQAEQARSALTSEETFANDLYPLAVRGLLSGRSIGLVFLGGSSNRIDSLARAAVTQAGGTVATVVAVREPLDLAGLGRAAAGTRFAALATSAGGAGEVASTTTTSGGGASGEGTGAAGEPQLKLIEGLGLIVGRQLVSGGSDVQRELITRAHGPLLSAFDGQLGRLEGIVLVRNDPSTMTPRQTSAVGAFETGLLAGIDALQIPVVGAELSNSEPSQIPWFQGKDLSSVDDLDTTAGQAALIYALDGAHGSFGTKSTADSLLPSVVGGATQP